MWRWFNDGQAWHADKVITVPVEPAETDLLPAALQPFGALPPLVTDVSLPIRVHKIWLQGGDARFFPHEADFRRGTLMPARDRAHARTADRKEPTHVSDG